MMPVCPVCESEIELDELDIDEGETISCPDCGVDLQVVGLAPMELALAATDREGSAWVKA